MFNLYQNTISINKKKQFKYIKSNERNKYFKNLNLCFLILKDFWKELHNNKELVYQIIKLAKKEDLKNSFLNILFTQNFYIDIFSNSDEFPKELYYIIYKLINDLILDLKQISDYSPIFQESNLAYLLDGIILNNKIRSFFNLILSDIIEQYENSEENKQILMFQIDCIKKFFDNQEHFLVSHDSEKNEVVKLRKRQNTIFNKIYRMKLPNIQNEIPMNESFFEFDYDELTDKDYKNNEIFARKYLQEINKNDILELFNKEKNELMKNYISNQLSLMESDINIYSNKKFLEKIQKEEMSVKILYFYQRSFMIVIKIIKKIFVNLNKHIEIIPEELKNISIMLMKSLKKKYNSIRINEMYLYISEFFMRIFKSYFLSPDYNALINSVILSHNTKHNLKIIFDILSKLMSGKFYNNSEKEECDLTPFNLFFLEIIPSVFKFYEKLLENSNFNEKIENIEINIYNELNNKKNINSVSIIYSVNQLTSLINIINDNFDKIFLDNNQNGFEKEELKLDFLKVFKKLIENYELLDNTTKNDKNIIYFFSYNIISYSQKLLDIINRNKNKYFKINELKGEKTDEEVNLNKIIRAKNFLFDLLYISPKLYKLVDVYSNSRGKNTLEILKQLDKYFKGISIYSENNEKSIIDDNLNNNEKSKIPKEWYLNSLMVCLENLDNEYSKNDYEKLYDSIKEDLKDSINNYDFGELGQVSRELKIITFLKDKLKNLQDKYRDVALNLNIRKIIENEPIEILMNFTYNNNQKIFNIIKIENNNSKNNSNLNNNKSLIKCLTINDFIKKFPNLSLIQQRQDIDLFLIEREINLSRGLNLYFDILKQVISIKFGKEEKNIVFNKIQKYILIKIYDKIYPKESDNDDIKIFQKTVLLSWIRPHHLKLDKTYLDNFLPITSKYINQLDNEKSPNGKFNIINKIFNAINNVLRFIKGCSFSIDDIAPVCEYCLIKAQPERLSSNLKYLKNFISKDGSDLRKMRFDILNNCMNSIKEINYKKFEGVSKEEYDNLCIMARGMTIK